MKEVNTLNRNIEDIRKLKKIIFELRLKYDNIENEELKKNIKVIIQTGDKVYAELIKNNRKTVHAYKFIISYLPTIDKITGKYIVLTKNEVRSKDSLDLQEKILETMPQLKEALIRYYESMFNADIQDIDVEIEYLLRQI